MTTARLDSKFAQHAKTDAGNMAFLAILLGLVIGVLVNVLKSNNQ